MEILKIFRRFCLSWTGSCRNRSKVISFSTNNTNFGKIFDFNGARSKFWGCQGRRTGVGVTTASNSLILGGWVTKILKNGDKK